MRRLLLAGLVLPFFVAPALSQTAGQSSSPSPVVPAPSGLTATPAPMPAPSGLTATTPPATSPTAAMPKPGGPTAMTPTPSTTMSTTAPTTMPTTGSVAVTGGAPGANSFTEGQAKTRLEDKGYTAVSGLKKGEDGVWRGTAMKNAKSVSVGVDYKGDISGG